MACRRPKILSDLTLCVQLLVPPLHLLTLVGAGSSKMWLRTLLMTSEALLRTLWAVAPALIMFGTVPLPATTEKREASLFRLEMTFMIQCWLKWVTLAGARSRVMTTVRRPSWSGLGSLTFKTRSTKCPKRLRTVTSSRRSFRLEDVPLVS